MRKKPSSRIGICGLFLAVVFSTCGAEDRISDHPPMTVDLPLTEPARRGP